MPDIFINPPKKDLSKKKKLKPVQLASRGEPAPFHFWSAFIPHPPKIKFDTQDKQEEIVLLLRAHPITNLPWIIMVAMMSGASFLILKFVNLNFIPGNFVLISFLSWYLLIFALAFSQFLRWFFGVFIITDERVIDIDFPNMLFRSIAQTKIDKIQNVSIKTGGYIRSLFDYGNVLIQSAEAVPQIIFEGVPNPERVTEVLDQLILAEEQEKIDGRTR